MDCYGSSTALFGDNIVQRGRASGVKEALVLGGNFAVTGNRFVGFDEAAAVAIRVQSDPLGKTWEKNCTGNVFVNCAGDLAIQKR